MAYLHKSVRNDIPYFDLRSALQKHMRRGHIHKMLWIASEFDLTGYGNAVFEYLKLFCIEDISIANCNLLKIISDYQKEWKKEKSEPKKRKMLLKCSKLVAISPKLRITDNVYHYTIRTKEEEEYDEDTLKEYLDNKNIAKSVMQCKNGMENKEWKSMRKVFENYEELEIYIPPIFSLPKKEAFILGLVMLILIRCYEHKEQENKTTLDEEDLKVYEEDMENEEIMKDYVYDKHTRKGRSLKRGLLHFLTIGAVVMNKSEIEDKYAEKLIKIIRDEEKEEEEEE